MLKNHQISSYLHKSTLPTLVNLFNKFAQFSTNKVIWRKDSKLDSAINNDKVYNLCRKVVKDVVNEPDQVIPLHYLERRRERLGVSVKIKDFLEEHPGLFDVYLDEIKPKTERVPFLRISSSLEKYLEEEKRVKDENEWLIVEKLCKLLLMSKDKVIVADKLDHMKREFGFPDDFLFNLVPKYKKYFRLVGEPGDMKTVLELVSWEDGFEKSVIEKRAEEEERLMGVPVRPSFNWKLPPGFFIKKEMMEWVKEWKELPYISPYADASDLEQPSPEMEKRTVGVLHEMLSLSLLKRMPVPIIGKVKEEYRFSNRFSTIFTRHSGLFYVSSKGGIQTAVLREAYEKDVLIDSDPLLVIKDKFVELLEEGKRNREKQLKWNKGEVRKDMEMVIGSTLELDQL
ncbi:hypothetical protein ACHQM5_015015 [Ranunculus cassubicifolius]